MATKLQRLRALLRENWKLKLLALLVAVISYKMIRSTTGKERDLPVRVEVDAPGVAVLEKYPEVVMVRFRGTQDDLLKLDQNQLKVTLRPRKDHPDGLPRVTPIRRRDVSCPAGLTIRKIEPDAVVITFDQEVTQTFAVTKPRTIGRPLVGNVEVEFEPQQVSVRGPKRLLEEMRRENRDRVTTEPVDVDGRIQSFTRRVKVLPPDDTMGAQVEPSEIQVRINIATETITRIWTNAPLLILRTADSGANLMLTPRHVNVGIIGPPDIVQGLDESTLRVFVDTTGLDPTLPHQLPVQVFIPGAMDLNTTTTPATVTATFREQDNRGRRTP